MNTSMHRPVIVITHAPWETPALIDIALGELPTIRRTVLDDPAPELPPPSNLGGVVVMGGPQDADDDRNHAGLAAERRLLAEAVAADIPVLGVCLGMQLLALALGARLYHQHGVEIGFAPIDLTSQGVGDPVLGSIAHAHRHPLVLHWHSDAVELPAGATLLASTPATPVQAFRANSALGTQFHPEADAPLLTTWLATPQMVLGMSAEDVQRIRRDGERCIPLLRESALSGFGEFISAVQKRRE